MTVSQHTLAGVRSYRRTGQTVLLDMGGPCLAVTLLSDRMVRVRLAHSGSFAPRRSWAVARPDEAFAPVSYELSETPTMLVLHTGTLRIQIACDTGAVSFIDREDRCFCDDVVEDMPGRTDGVWKVCGTKRIAADEHFYGFGERTGGLDKRGQRLVNWATDQYQYGTGTDPLYIAIPTLLAVRPGLAYGVFFNNTWRSAFDMGAAQDGCWQMLAEGGELDYYVIYGPTPAEVLTGFGQVLGTTPLPPRWALGYHQSRWSYMDERETRDLVAEFRRRDLPLDAVHLDIDYMDGYRDFTWHAGRFPDPARLVSDLRDAGVRVVPIIDAGVKIDPDYGVYRDGKQHDMFLRRADGDVFHGYVWPDDSVFADFARPDVRAWWGQQQAELARLGIGGIWNDMNEPTVFERPFSEGGGPPRTIDLDAPQGECHERTVHAETHNLYGQMMAQACYEGLRATLTERPFVLTRSGYAGIQRWSACWMGDNMSRWDHLEMAMPQLINMGLSGVPFVGVDIGGFHGNASGELFARWMQFGALMPFARGHSTANTARHEPWAFGPAIEAICRTYMQLRYQLLPYLYTLFWEANQTGAPVLRPLFYHFPDDMASYQFHDQVMLGPWLLAAPVYQPGRTCRAVYLPEGRWHDWWTGEVVQGPTHLLADAPLERMPLFVRAGAILPRGPVARSTGAHPLNVLTLDCFCGAGEWTLYEDDGASFAYEQGQYCTTRYQMWHDDVTLHVRAAARAGQYTPAPRTLILRIHTTAGIQTVAADDTGAANEWQFAL